MDVKVSLNHGRINAWECQRRYHIRDVKSNLFWALAVLNINECMERIGTARIEQTGLANSCCPRPVWAESILE
jgi:hypothetical protein